MKKYLPPLIALTLLLSIGFVAYAQSVGGTPENPSVGGTPLNVKVNNPFNVCGASGCGLLDFLNSIVDNILKPLAGVAIVLAFIWTGFKYVMARGNSTKIKDANQALRFTVIGSAIILAAAAITKVITGTLSQLQTH